jgi:hypothetical protein
VSGPTTRNRTPSLLGATGSSISPVAIPPDTMAAMHPRTRDFVGAAILAIVLIALLIYVVSLGAQGR